MNIFELYASLKLDDSEYEQGLTDAEKKAYHIGEGIGTSLRTAGQVGGAALKATGAVVKGVGMAIGATAAAITPLVKSAVSAYGEQQQLVGGMETLYKSSSDTMIKYANEAYKTAGLSANEYMNTAIESSAAMINSLGGDTEKAAEMTNMAIIDMSDNVNKMGTSMESIQNAYRGFSRGNFTMLDNLALGFSGTKEGMQELLDKAQELSGVEYDIGSYADIVNAIHVVQTEMGITGTTSKEAGETITGSLGSVKAAWENLVAGIGGGQDLAPLIDNLVTSLEGALTNLLPTIEQSLNGVANLISSIAPIIAEKLPQLAQDILPPLIDAAVSILDGLIQALPSILGALQQVLPIITEAIGALIEGITSQLPQLISIAQEIMMVIFNALMDNLPLIVDAAVQIMLMLVDGLMEALPQLAEAAVQVILALVEGISGALPELIPAAVEAILAIVDALVNNVDLLIDGAIALMLGLAEGLIEALPVLVEKAPEIVIKLVEAIIRNAPKLLQAAIELIITLVDGMVQAFGKLIEVGAELVQKVKDGFSQKVEDAKNWGRDMIQNFIDGILEKWNHLKETVSNVAQTVKDFLGFSEPKAGPLSNFHTYAPDMMDLFIKGIQDSEDALKDQISSTFDFSPTIGAQTVQTQTVSESTSQIPVNVSVYLEGDAQGIFRVVRTENDTFTKANGVSAFA